MLARITTRKSDRDMRREGTRNQAQEKRYRELGPSEDYLAGYAHGYGDGQIRADYRPDIRMIHGRKR